LSCPNASVGHPFGLMNNRFPPKTCGNDNTGQTLSKKQNPF